MRRSYHNETESSRVLQMSLGQRRTPRLSTKVIRGASTRFSAVSKLHVVRANLVASNVVLVSSHGKRLLRIH